MRKTYLFDKSHKDKIYRLEVKLTEMGCTIWVKLVGAGRKIRWEVEPKDVSTVDKALRKRGLI